jgi:hypothetical protein
MLNKALVLILLLGCNTIFVVGHDADVLEVHAGSIFRIEMRSDPEDGARMYV